MLYASCHVAELWQKLPAHLRSELAVPKFAAMDFGAPSGTSFGLELPIARGTRLLLDSDLLSLVVREANNRLHDNFARISRFVHAMKGEFGFPTLRVISGPGIGTLGDRRVTRMQGQGRRQEQEQE